LIGNPAGSTLAADDPTRVLEAGKLPQDARLGKPKDLNGYFPFTPPTSKSAWEKRRGQVRQQVLVATGLWPMPEKTPLTPVIHGKIDRDGYTIEKVYFTSYPGHYVCGNLYRPKGGSGKRPAVLSPHGHWRNGRFTDEQEVHNEKYIQTQISEGAEKTVESARFPLQARCAQLARMGCVVFHYDMVGYADSQAIAHRAGFTDTEAELRLQSFMGLQTFNSVRALDFLLSLPDVDTSRVGVTGASGGGTQTFILCAIDDRPTAAFPAVMVSTAMQGGCVCENCSLLRQDTGNVELAGLFAPKPLGMTGANDWTIAIENKGLPELKTLYKLYGAEKRVMAKCFPQFGHNYNQVSREVMYDWFNQNLRLVSPVPIEEGPFVPVPPKELSVFDDEHPRPRDFVGVDELRKSMTAMSDKQMAGWQPKDAESFKEFTRIIGTALRVMINDELPDAAAIDVKRIGGRERDGYRIEQLILGRTGKGEAIPAILVAPAERKETIVVWIHPEGKSSLMQDGKWAPAARQILQRGISILAPDVFLTGEFADAPTPPVDAKYAGFTYGYNRTLLANRVHDILTAIAFAQGRQNAKTIDLVGFGKAGPWVLMARPLCGQVVARTAADVNGFRFEDVKSVSDEMMLPGALKYGGLASFVALCAPGELFIHNHEGTTVADKGKMAYQAAGVVDRLLSTPDKAAPENVVQWLLR
jgi:dienelactone hydrolase